MPKYLVILHRAEFAAIEAGDDAEAESFKELVSGAYFDPGDEVGARTIERLPDGNETPVVFTRAQLLTRRDGQVKKGSEDGDED